MPVKMKDSGIVWIGKIPENWKIVRIDSLYSERRTVVSDFDYPALSVTKRGIVLQLETAAKTNAHNSRRLVKTNDFVINSRSDRRGSCGISSQNGSVSLINTVLKPNQSICFQYFDWLFHTKEFADEFYRWGHGIVDDLWTTNWSDMRKMSVTFPPSHVQSRIATFLDKKSTEIDSLIDKTRQSIEEYRKYRQSVITKAVTKGLDPDVEMKDSGVEWIGKMPLGWNVHPVYYLFCERKNKNRLGLEKNLLSLSYGKIIKKNIDTKEGLLPSDFSGYNIIEPNDIVIRPTDLQNDKRSLRTGFVSEHGIITSAYITIFPKTSINSNFFHYLLHSYDLMKVFYNMGNGVRQGLNYSDFSKLPLLIPTIIEQQQIVSFLDSKCSRIDSIIEKKQKLIDELEAYKKSIIYQYVTGKKEVRS